MEIYKKLAEVQKALKAPKGQYNSFAKYNYRSCEDILEALKPILGDATVFIYDELVQIGDRYYVKANATFLYGEEAVSATAFAREEVEKKGMDASQITGMASSYARKYALNGLFLIDDTKDADTKDNTKEEKPKKDNVKQLPLKDDLTEEKATFAAKCAELYLSDADVTAFKRHLFKTAPTKAELAAVNEKFAEHYDLFAATLKEA